MRDSEKNSVVAYAKARGLTDKDILRILEWFPDDNMAGRRAEWVANFVRDKVANAESRVQRVQDVLTSKGGPGMIAVLMSRFRGGESVADLEDDYGLERGCLSPLETVRDVEKGASTDREWAAQLVEKEKRAAPMNEMEEGWNIVVAGLARRIRAGQEKGSAKCGCGEIGHKADCSAKEEQ